MVLGCSGAVWAQEDDGWGEIVGLMNGLSAANQQLLGQGLRPGAITPAEGGLSPGFLQGFTSWAQTYAQVLQSMTGSVEENGTGFDPLRPKAPDVLWEALGRWQAGTVPQDTRSGRLPQQRGFQWPQQRPTNPLYAYPNINPARSLDALELDD